MPNRAWQPAYYFGRAPCGVSAPGGISARAEPRLRPSSSPFVSATSTQVRCPSLDTHRGQHEHPTWTQGRPAARGTAWVTSACRSSVRKFGVGRAGPEGTGSVTAFSLFSYIFTEYIFLYFKNSAYGCVYSQFITPNKHPYFLVCK